jgi:hypothetical protein
MEACQSRLIGADCKSANGTRLPFAGSNPAASFFIYNIKLIFFQEGLMDINMLKKWLSDCESEKQRIESKISHLKALILAEGQQLPFQTTGENNTTIASPKIIVIK